MSDEPKAGGESDEKILEEAHEDFRLCQAAEKENREAALEDLEFARLGKQWPQNIIDKREEDKRPCMTFNRMPTFIRQVVNDGRQNKPAIKVHPADDQADVQTAGIINGLIRNIEYTSSADIAYDTALDFAASCGFGYWRVDVEYTHDDTFDTDITISPIHNPFSVYGDWADVGADSSEWNRAFIVDAIEKDVFESKYKGKEKVDWDGDTYQKMPAEWMEGEKILVAEYWRRKEVTRQIALLSDGRVVDKAWLDKPIDGIEQILPEAANVTNGTALQQAGINVVDERETRSYKVCQYVLNGVEVLEKREWAGKYIPIIPVYGESINIEGKRVLKSLIRDAKDAQRNFNYWRTTTTELIALSPKAPYIGAVGQFDTDADKWSRANTDSVPYIEYDQVPGALPPQRQPFAGVPAGALQEALNASDDMKTIIGIFDASLGARSNETSGRAINARKSEADTGTFHFIDNQARAIRHTGRIIIDLIPSVYNKARIVRIMGEDKQPQNVPINQAQAQDGQGQVFDLTIGKYDLTVDVGPGFQTKREEAAYGMTELLRAFPQGAPVIAPELAKAQDWPGAEDIAKKLEAVAGNDPRLQQAQQQMQQMQGQVQQLSNQLHQAEQDKQLDWYKAQTDRIKVESAAMSPQQIQALIIQTLQQALGGAQQQIKPPPNMDIHQPQPGQAPGFFMGEQNG